MSYGISIKQTGGGSLDLTTTSKCTMVGFFHMKGSASNSSGRDWRVDKGFSSSVHGLSFPRGVKLTAMPTTFSVSGGYGTCLDSGSSLNWDETSKSVSGRIVSNYTTGGSKQWEVLVLIFADYSNCKQSSDSFGAWMFNDGVAAILSSDYLPLASVSKSITPIHAGGGAMSIPLPSFGVAYSDSVMRWVRGAVFSGAINNCPYISKLVSVGSSFRLDIIPCSLNGLGWFVQYGESGGDWQSRDTGFKHSDSLYMVVGGVRTSPPNGYGLVIYNPNGSINCCFDYQAPIICKTTSVVPSVSSGISGNSLSSIAPSFSIPSGSSSSKILSPPISRESSVNGWLPMLYKRSRWTTFNIRERIGIGYYTTDGVNFHSVSFGEAQPYTDRDGYHIRLQATSAHIGGQLMGSYRVGFLQMSDYFDI